MEWWLVDTLLQRILSPAAVVVCWVQLHKSTHIRPLARCCVRNTDPSEITLRGVRVLGHFLIALLFCIRSIDPYGAEGIFSRPTCMALVVAIAVSCVTTSAVYITSLFTALCQLDSRAIRATSTAYSSSHYAKRARVVVALTVFCIVSWAVVVFASEPLAAKLDASWPSAMGMLATAFILLFLSVLFLYTTVRVTGLLNRVGVDLYNVMSDRESSPCPPRLHPSHVQAFNAAASQVSTVKRLTIALAFLVVGPTAGGLIVVASRILSDPHAPHCTDRKEVLFAYGSFCWVFLVFSIWAHWERVWRHPPTNSVAASTVITTHDAEEAQVNVMA